MAVIIDDQEVAALRTSGRILADAMQLTVSRAKAGITTAELDRIAVDEIRRQGGQPSFLGFQGYPSGLCVSINSEVVHGIPSSKRKLADGDIVGLDLGVVYDGLYTDHAVTIAVGKVPAEAQRLIADTNAALAAGLRVIKPGRHVGDISAAIQASLDPHGYGIIRQLTGHGVGRGVHEPPVIPNTGHPKTGPKLQVGDVLAIEPMVSLGDWSVETSSDGWTVVTSDGSLAAHAEHTVRVTDVGCEIITEWHGKGTGA